MMKDSVGALCDHLLVGVYKVDAKTAQITFANPVAARLFGYATPAALLNKKLKELAIQFYPPRDTLEKKLKKNNFILHHESVLTRSDGSQRHVLENMNAVCDARGKVQYYLATLEDITAYKQVEEKLHDSELHLAEAQHLAHIGSWELGLENLEDINANYLLWSAEVFRIFGYEPGGIAVTNESFFRAVHPDDRLPIQAAIQKSIQEKIPYMIVHRIILPGGKIHFVREKADIVYDEKTNKPIKMLGTIQDITEQEQIEEARRASEKKYRELIELSPYGIFIQSEGKIVFANESFLKMLGAVSHEDVIGKPFLDFIHPSYISSAKKRTHYSQNPERKVAIRIEEKYIGVDGRVVEVEVLGSPFSYEGKPAVQVIVNDVTMRKATEKQLAYLAYHDVLTGLSNRTKLEDVIEFVLKSAQRRDEYVAFLFMDLDRFKTINDVLGHDIGDKLLKEVAERLLKNFRKNDMVVRLGGDEFVIVLTGVASAEAVGKVANKILKLFKESFLIESKQLFITPSIGISMYPNDGKTIADLLKNADIAMYSAKDAGRNNFQFCTKDLTLKIQNRVLMDEQLRHALEKNTLTVFYQPKIEAKTGKIVGVEALLRWLHEEGDFIPPDKFIPIAEETGLIVPITEFVLHQVCQQHSYWQSLGLNVPVSVNFSVRLFGEPDLPNSVISILEGYHIDSENFEIEITESFFMQDVERNIQILKEFKKKGVKIAIDDFGTGYSSLNYLKRFNVDKIKIDKIFIQDLPTDKHNVAIVNAVIAMAHSLGAVVIAEGVETQAQFDFLAKKSCDQIQGYYFCKPMSGEAMTKLLRERYES